LRPSVTAFAFSLGASICFVPACGSGRISSPDAGVVICSAVGCQDQFAAVVSVDATTVPAGTHVIKVTADGTEMSCSFPFPPTNVPDGHFAPQCTSGLTFYMSQAQVCTTTTTGTVVSSDCQPVSGKFEERLTIPGTPRMLHVQQLAGDVVVLDQTVAPTYQINQPNGPQCEPTCHQASVAWTIATGAPPEIAEQPCDPLAAPPIMLGAVIGVGQDDAGTLYVDATNGIFVSSGGTLVRQHVVGTGQMGSDQFAFSFVAPGEAAASARDLLVQTDGTSAVSMSLGPSGSGKTGSDAGVTALTVVAASTVERMPIVNTPNVIQYVGDVANGNVVVATVPLNQPVTSPDGGVEDGSLSIFYGPPSAVAQRPIAAFQQSLSGNGSLTFLVEGTPTVLTFGNLPSPDTLGTFTLMTLTPQGGAPIAVTLESPTPAALPGFSFTCLP